MRWLVRVFWGPRPEPTERLAGRWRQTLAQVSAVLPAGVRTWSQVHPDRPATELTPDLDTLLSALAAAQRDEAWSDLTGTGLRLAGTGGPGWQVEVSGLAGGSPEFLLQSLVVVIASRDDRATGLGDRLLTLLAETWEPDFGDVTDDEQLDALEDAGYSVGDPVIGRAGYLSPTRAALVPAALRTAGEPLPDGGVVLHLSQDGDPATVVDAYRELQQAGALEPLPRPMTRPRL